MRVRELFSPLLVAALSLAYASAQGYDPSYFYGTVPFQTHLQGEESINLSNGNLHFQIPLVSLPGRNGHDFVYSLSYNSQVWWGRTFVDGQGHNHYFWQSNGNWNLDFPQIRFDTNAPAPTGGSRYSCNSNFRVSLPDGRQFYFPIATSCTDTLYNVPAPEKEQSFGSSVDPTAPAGGGCVKDFAYLSVNPWARLVLESGETLRFDPSGTVRDEDANGNTITYASSNGIVTYTDTAGRTIQEDKTAILQGNAGQVPITYKDSNGVVQTITLTYGTQLFAPHFHWGQANDPTPWTGHPLSSITYPNGDRYDFQYNDYGEITKIIYPTGGYTRYDYGYAVVNPTGLDVREVVGKHICRDPNSRANLDQNGLPGSCVALPEDNTVIEPTIAWNSPPSNSATKVTSPTGDYTTYTFAWGGGAGAVETQRKYFPAGSTTPLRTVDTDLGSCRVPIEQRVTLDDGSVIKTQWARANTSPVYYYQTTGSAALTDITSKKEYAFNAALARQTTTNYLHTNPVNGQDYTSTAIHILNRKTSEVVADGNGTPVSQTTYEYDNYSPSMQSSGATQLDSAYTAGAVPLITARGNVTAVKRWLNTNNSWLTTSNTYDDAGNVLSTTAPSNSPFDSFTRTTTFSYADNFTDGINHNAKAYVTQTTLPATGSIAHVEKKQYFYNTGLIAASCGQNFSAACTNSATLPQPDYSTFTYERLGRERVVTHGDGGQDSTCYSDDPDGPCYSTAAQLSETESQKVTTTLSKTVVSFLDGVGHVIQTQLTSDPDGTTIVDTAYDGEGRKKTVSNPYRSASDGNTTFNYDALDRVVSAMNPDGSTVTTSYTGNTTTVTDEAGKARKTQTDALGRLTAVWEDPGLSPHLNYETDYQYDLLDNLTRVDQKGTAPTDTTKWRTRTFAYNSLSQLLCSANPEIAIVTCPNPDNGAYTPGTIRYAYDNVGNLFTKTSPKPNQSSPSVTVQISYSYDAENRLLQKSYNDGSTATVKYGYDGIAPTGCSPAPPSLVDSFPVGRRTSMCDGSGATSWKHDEMARTLQDKRKIGSTSALSVIYTYNLDGSTKTLKYPSTNTVKYTTSGAGRPTAAQDVANSVNYVQNAHYAPFGGLTGMTQGATPITTTNVYNNRLQPILLSASTPTATIISLCYDFHLGVAVNTPPCSFPAYTSGNNGNVYQIVNNRNGNRTQNFMYDSLNRIQQAWTNGTGAAGWGETFGPTVTNPGVPPSTPGIDAWGNLTNRSGVSNRNNTEPFACPADGQNHLTTCSLAYDAAGNTTSNGSATYTYDAENRLTATAGVSYTYDGDGKRVKKSNGTLYWTGAGSGTLAESDLSGTMQKEYVFFNGKRIARRDLPGTPSTKYYFSDNLGSASVITNDVGVMAPPLEESDYYPYGGEIPITNGDPNAYKFTGKERDTESGLDDFGARYYSSTVGRFMTLDWAEKPTTVPYAHFGNPQSLNLYSYVQNNPTTVGDPDGHCAILCTAAIGAVAGAVVELGREVVKGDGLSGKKILVAAAAGGIAGATLGLGTAAAASLGLGGSATLGVEAAAGALGNMAGGATERGINEGAAAAGDLGEMAKDAAFGVAGVGLGKAVGKVAESAAGGGALKQVQTKLGFNKLGAARRARLQGQEKVLQNAVSQARIVAEAISDALQEGAQKSAEQDEKRKDSKHAECHCSLGN